MTKKHSPVHPALRIHFVTVPWKRRRRINFNAWARVTAKTEPIPGVPSATVPTLLRAGPCSLTGRFGTIKEARRPRCS
jgi:hypothetical protein